MGRYHKEEIAVLREGGKLLSQILNNVIDGVKPGVTAKVLDKIARELIMEAGGEPSFLGYRAGGPTPFPSALCVSLNSAVVHAPAISSTRLEAGDIVGLDIGMRYPKKVGLCTDMAMTLPVGDISSEAERLITVTSEALKRGIAAVRAGRKVRHISEAVQKYVEGEGFSIVRELVGHGVGRAVHEKPEIPNFVSSGPFGDYILKPGLVIAIEPMVNMGKANVRTLEDNWTVVTVDNSLSAHFEHTIVVTKDGAEVLTKLSDNE